MRFLGVDVHSVVHFVGCYAFVPTIMQVLGWGVWPAAALAIALGIVWEVLDEINYRKSLRISILDPRGADLGDLMFDAAGVLLAVWIF